jgi:RNA polymerase sigma factor (sigma-70 family)
VTVSEIAVERLYRDAGAYRRTSKEEEDVIYADATIQRARGTRVPDGVLVEQALAGDQCAFDILVRRYQRLLVSYIHSFLKDGEQVYDVLQHVFLKLYVSLPILLTDVPLKGWLFQVAHNRCLDELRRRYRKTEIPFSTLEWEYREEELPPIEVITDPEPLPEEIVERIELHCLLQQAIFLLPPTYRSIVHLRCFRQLSFSEIGRMLGMPESTVKTYFSRSLPLLRRELTSSVRFASIS